MTKPTSAAAPSLLGATTSPALGAPSLLSSLDGAAQHQTRKKRRRPLFWLIAIPLLLIGLLVSAAVMIAHSAVSAIAPASPPAPLITAAPVPKPAPASEVKTPVTPKEEVPVQVATIINDLPPAAQKKSTEAETAASNDPHDRLSQALTGAQTMPSKTASAMPETRTSPTQEKPPAGSDKVAPLKQAAKPKHKEAEINDRDVSLLATLVANSKEIVTPNKTSHQKTNNKAIPENKSSAARDDSRNPDIVERKPGDSTASLLKRCKKLGMIEGELCRWRICSDHWDTDLACKADARPKSPIADNATQ